MKSFCLVTSEIVGPFKNGGIGTHCYYLAQYLATKPDIRTTIVYNGAIDNGDVEYWRKKFQEAFQADFVWIHPLSTEFQQVSSCSPYWDGISRANFDYLRSNHHDVILFQEMLGGGFRAIQAKRSLGLFRSSLLVVMVHSSWQWVNESMQLYPIYGLPEMLTKFMERYSIQHCDALVSPSQYMLEWTACDVKQLPKYQNVLPYLFDPSLGKTGHENVVNELIFFGRLEQRKGLVLFLEAMLAVKNALMSNLSNRSIPVYFLGKPGQTIDGDGAMTISRYVSLLAPVFDLRVVDDLGHLEALEFLRQHSSAMVLCPSLQDNSPYAVIENLLLDTNLISCLTGGIPELFADQARLAKPTVADLSRLLLDGFCGRLLPLKAAYSVGAARAVWDEFLEQAFRHNLPYLPHASSEEIYSPIQKYLGAFGLIVGPDSAKSVRQGLEFCDVSVVFDQDQLQSSEALTKDGSLASRHWVVLGPECSLSADFEESIRLAIGADSKSVWTCFSEFKADDDLLHAPLGPCLEASLTANVFGTGLAVLPGHVLVALSAHGRDLLGRVLVDNSYFWAFLAQLALEGHGMDVIPARLAVIENGSCALENGIASYPQQSSIMIEMARNLPDWASRLLPYTVELNPSSTIQGSRSSNSAPPNGGDFSIRGALRDHFRRLRDRFTRI